MRAALTLLIIACLAAPVHAVGRAKRELVLWAWERPEDLRFVGQSVEVRFLAGTVTLREDGVDYLPRAQPLYVEKDAIVRPVVHIASWQRASLATASEQTREKLVKLLVAVGEKYDSLQLDFDARKSERTAYIALLTALRRDLPEKTRLQITGLASWCDDGAWLEGAPIDELAPQYFRMGETRSLEPRGVCRDTLGLSVDELPTAVPNDVRKIYLFNPKRWTAETFSDVQRRFGE